MSTEIIIRLARPADTEALIAFNQAMALETEGKRLDPEILSAGVAAVFADEKKGFYVVAENAGAIVGGLMITFEWSDWRNGMVWWLQSVYIAERHRKNGVFRKMFENLKQMADEDNGIAGLRLYVDKTNLRAQKVYQAMGMNGEHYSVFELMK